MFFTCVNSITANNCRNSKQNVPACPQSGSRHLNETYPEVGFVASIPNLDEENHASTDSFTTKFIFEIMQSDRFQENGPPIYLPAPSDYCNEVKDALEDYLEDQLMNPDALNIEITPK